jgi:hypothetical protein
MDGWVEHEIAGCHMRDARLKRRLGEVLRRLAEQPEQSIPAACQSWAQTQAAYRFLDNDHVSPYEWACEVQKRCPQTGVDAAEQPAGGDPGAGAAADRLVLRPTTRPRWPPARA